MALSRDSSNNSSNTPPPEHKYTCSSNAPCCPTTTRLRPGDGKCSYVVYSAGYSSNFRLQSYINDWLFASASLPENFGYLSESRLLVMLLVFNRYVQSLVSTNSGFISEVSRKLVSTLIEFDQPLEHYMKLFSSEKST